MPLCVVQGELDPERIGSGIQYGDTALRRLSRQQRTERRPDCSCWLPEIPFIIMSKQLYLNLCTQHSSQ